MNPDLYPFDLGGGVLPEPQYELMGDEDSFRLEDEPERRDGPFVLRVTALMMAIFAVTFFLAAVL